MTVRIGPGDHLGQEDWDRLVLAQPQGNLLQSWAWGELQARFGWRVERFRIDGDGSGVCSLQSSKTAFPGGAVYYIPRGPLVTEGQRALVLQEILARARRGGGIVVRVEPPARAGDPWTQVLAGLGFSAGERVQPGVTLLLDLRPEPTALRAGFKPKTRYNLGLAERRGVVVAPSDDVAAFATLCAATARRQGIALPGSAYYRTALELFGTSGARLYLARQAERLLAGILVIRFGPTAYYLFGGSAEEGRELMPNYLLHWTAMLDFRAMGCTTYDWWGIAANPAPSDPWFGLHRFKAGFGGERVEYLGLFELALRPRAWRWEARLRKLKRRLRASILR